MKYQYILLIIITLSFATSLSAQQESILVNAERFEQDNGQVTVKFYPLSASLWDSLNTIGYKVERQELDNNMQPIGSMTTIANRVLPKDTAWFSAQGTVADNGYLNTLGDILYNPDFQYEDNSELNANEIRYNLLVYEASLADHIAANALGLMFRDSTASAEKIYSYRVSTLDGQYSEEIFMDGLEGAWASSENVDLRFRFPNGGSISAMMNRFGDTPTDQIPLILKTYGDSIVLRWAPNHSELFYSTLETGYYIVRYDKGLGQAGDTIAHVMPYQQTEITKSIIKDSIALIAAQILYGEKNYTPQDATESDADYKNNFSFALYAAERSALAADILGLRFVDEDVEPGLTYTYRIYTPSTSFFLATMYETVENTSDGTAPPVEFRATAGDKVITLVWNKFDNQRRFSSYVVERSDGNSPFKSISRAPLIFMEDARVPTTEFSYNDSVYVNDVEFIYRLRGIDAFAEMSSAVELRASAKDLTPPDEARMDTVFFNAVGRNIEINWYALPYTPEDFAGYQVMIGNTMDGAFTNISGILPPNATFYEYKNDTTFDGQTAHYFKIATLDKSGNRAESVARYAHIPDLKAPEAPTELEGFIDEDGIVTLAWTHSVDTDVAGYYVYFANNPNDEFSPMNKRPINANIFYDTIPVNSLNEKIYYAVAAEDKLDNRGRVSDMIALARPDVVPPLRPIMNAVESNNEGVKVSWNTSASTDVVRYEVNRRQQGATEWEVVGQTVSPLPNEPNDLIYEDNNMIVGKIYEYAVRAIDDADLYSDYAFPRQGQQNFGGEAVMIENLNLKFDESQNKISLKWDFQPPVQIPENVRDYYFYIYKSYGGEVIKEVTRTDSNVFTFTDEEIEQGVLHNYAIQVVFDTGHTGKMSEVQSIEIP